MSGFARVAVFTAFLVFAITVAAHAAPAHNAGVHDGLTALKMVSPAVKVHLSAGNPIPHGLFNVNVEAPGLSPETAARAFLNRFAGVYTLDLPGMTLETHRVITTGSGATVQLSPRFYGIEIVGAQINVVIDQGNTILSVTTGMRPMRAIETRPSLNELDAWNQALSFVDWTDRPVVKNFDPRGAKLVVFMTGAGPVLAYAVSVSQMATMHFWKVYVDARTGALLFRRPNALHLNKARVYDPNPGFAMDQPVVEVTIDDFVDNAHATDKTLNGVRIITKNCAGATDPQDLFDYNGTLYRGPLCEMIFKTQADANGDFTAEPVDPTECVALSENGTQAELDACFEKNSTDEFAEVMMYYHANRMYNYYRDFGFGELKVSPIVAGVNLKIPNMYDLFQGGATCEPGKDASGNDITICTTTRFMPFDNAMFAPYDPNNTQYSDFFGVDQDAILFGQGQFIDFSYDGDVIYHEFTHAVIDTLTQNQMIDFDEYGMVIEPGAIHEGMADYFSSAITGDPKTGNYARHADPSADSMTMSPDAIRDIGVQVKCLDDTWGEVHQDGLVISNAAWEVKKLFIATYPAKDVKVLDKAIYDSMASWGPVPRFKDVTEAILTQIKASPEMGPAFEAEARKRFEANNAHDCPRVLPLANGTSKMIVFTDNYGQLNFWAGYFQFSFDVPPEATKLQMGFDAQSQGYNDALIKILFRKDEHVVINWDMFSGNNTFVADKEVELGTDNLYTIQVPDLVPGHTYYMAIANYGDSAILQNIFATFSTDPVEVDAGTPDAGGADGGTADGAVTVDGGADAGVDDDAAVATDTGVPADAGVTADAGTTGGADAAATPATDAGDEGGDKAAGCSCSTIGL